MTGTWTRVTPADVAGNDRSALVIGPFGSDLKSSDFTDSGVPLIFVRDIRSADFTAPRAYISSSKADELRAHVALPGDILITKMGEPPGDACIYSGERPAVITADCIRLRPTPEFDAGFIVHALRAPNVRHQIISITSGAAQQKVSLERFRDRIELLTPLLADQRRIARILDQAAELQEGRRRIIALYEVLSRSVFQSLFSEGVWPTSTLDDVSLIAGEYGANVPSVEPAPTLPRYVRITDIMADGSLTSAARAPGGEAESWARYRLEDGDLLFARSGATVGKVFRYRQVDGDCVFAGYLIRYRLDKSIADPDYIFGWTRSRAYGAWVAARQNVVAQPNINAKQYGRELQIPLPPIALQREYASILSRIRVELGVAMRAVAASDELFSSLQFEAFRGEL